MLLPGALAQGREGGREAFVTLTLPATHQLLKLESTHQLYPLARVAKTDDQCIQITGGFVANQYPSQKIKKLSSHYSVEPKSLNYVLESHAAVKEK